MAFSRVYSIFAERGLQNDVVFIGAGKLGLPDNAIVAFGLGVDLVNVGREAMLSVGCPPGAALPHRELPTGVATQDKWLAHGLDPTLKAARAANYIKTLRRDLLKVSEAGGVEHPALIGPELVEILDNLSDGRLLDEVYGYQPGWGVPAPAEAADLIALMRASDEQELGTEGPPEVAESDPRGDHLEGGESDLG